VVAARGARETARKARENPGGALLIGAVALMALSQLRGSIPKIPAVGDVADDIQIAITRFRDRFALGDLRMPGEDIGVLQTNIGDFVGGVFASQDDYMAEDEGPVPPVLVPRPFPTNPAAEAGARFGDWLFRGPGFDARDWWD